MGTTCLQDQQELKFSDFKQKNQYLISNSKQSITPAHQQIIRQLVPNFQHIQQYLPIAHLIQKSPQQQFTDLNFSQLETLPYAQKKPIHILFDYHQRRILHLYSEHQTQIYDFKQQQLQFTYLSSVIGFICRSKKMKDQIFLTKAVNNYNAYVVRLFSNGELSTVIIDDQIPTSQSKIKYLMIENGSQIWPLLLEKAWCKLIGSYNKARGLSPQDCFEEVTGIPAQSYQLNFQTNLAERLKGALKDNYWIALTAKAFQKNELKRFGTESKQVFLLINIEITDKDYQYYQIMSFFYQKKSSHEELGYSRLRRNQLKAQKIDLYQIRERFEYLTIGYNRDRFRTQSFSFTSKSQKNIFFYLEISHQCEINARVLQFYDEYLNQTEKSKYKYSPVLMELYHAEKGLVDQANNYNKAVRASNLSKRIFVNLKEGKYWLRVMVDWVDDKITNKANLVLYAQESKCSIKMEANRKECLQFFKTQFGKHITEKRQRIHEKQIQIVCIPKNYTYLLQVKNNTQNPIKFNIIFEDLQNLKLLHKKYIIKKQKISDFSLEGNQQQILQFIPIDCEEQILINKLIIEKQ